MEEKDLDTNNTSLEGDLVTADVPASPENTSKKKKLVFEVSSTFLVIMVVVIAVVVTLTMQNKKTDDTGKGDEGNESSVVVEDDAVDVSELTGGMAEVTIDGKKVAYNAEYIVDGVRAVVKAGTYESDKDDTVVFLVINGGSLEFEEGVVVNKTGSENFDGRGDAYSFYGTNSAIVVAGEESKVNLKNATINTSVNGANAVVATKGGSVEFSNVTISTTKNASRGLHATYGGTIVGEGGTILTQGQSCAALATDRGEGTVNVSKMTLKTAGAGSPLIYSTGAIEVSDSTGAATGAQIAVVEGKNSITLDGCDFSTNGIGNRNSVDNAAIMIYQSMSGDASEGVGSFTAKDTKMTVLADSEVYETTPFFFVTNTKANIELENVEATFYKDGYFILAVGTNEWGRTGENGGTVKIGSINLTATNTIVGVDEISSVDGI